MTKKEPVSVRFEGDVLDALKKLAARDERTISFMINRIVKDYLKAKKVLK
jgi:predicted transcriptional regulator